MHVRVESGRTARDRAVVELMQKAADLVHEMGQASTAYAVEVKANQVRESATVGMLAADVKELSGHVSEMEGCMVDVVARLGWLVEQQMKRRRWWSWLRPGRG